MWPELEHFDGARAYEETEEVTENRFIDMLDGRDEIEAECEDDCEEMGERRLDICLLIFEVKEETA